MGQGNPAHISLKSRDYRNEFMDRGGRESDSMVDKAGTTPELRRHPRGTTPCSKSETITVTLDENPVESYQVHPYLRTYAVNRRPFSIQLFHPPTH